MAMGMSRGQEKSFNKKFKIEQTNDLCKSLDFEHYDRKRLIRWIRENYDEMRFETDSYFNEFDLNELREICYDIEVYNQSQERKIEQLIIERD